jgi:hypothetical protein
MALSAPHRVSRQMKSGTSGIYVKPVMRSSAAERRTPRQETGSVFRSDQSYVGETSSPSGSPIFKASISIFPPRVPSQPHSKGF